MLELSQDQMAFFGNVAERNFKNRAVMELVLAVTPNNIEHQKDVLEKFVEECICKAKGYGIKNQKDTMLFIKCSHKHGLGFEESNSFIEKMFYQNRNTPEGLGRVLKQSLDIPCINLDNQKLNP